MGDQAAAGYVVGVAPAMLRIDIGIPVGVPTNAGLVLSRGFRRHIRFDADDRFDTLFDRGAPHFVCTMHVSVVGDADGGHIEFFGALDQIRNFRCAVKQRIMRMIMQLYEISGSSHAVQSTGDW